MQRIMEERPPTDSVNAASEKTILALQRQVETLTATLNNMQREMKNLAARTSAGASDDGEKDNRSPTESKFGTWTPELKFNPGWSFAKRKWYNSELKKNDPAKWKEVQKMLLEKRLTKLKE